MDTSLWLPLQALGTLAIVIAFAFWSYRRTRKKHDEHPEEVSALARREPDPQFRPDPEVTDPHHVTDAHPGEPDHMVDRDPNAVGTASATNEPKPVDPTAQAPGPRATEPHAKVKTFENR